MGRFRQSIRDDAGSLREIVNASSLAADDRKHDPAFQQALERVTRVRISHLFDTGVLVAISATAPLFMIVLPLLLPNTPAGLMPVLFGISVAFITAIAWGFRKRPELKQTAEVLLRYGICPSCTYNLGAGAQNESGMVTCPECGAFWSTDRIRHTHAFDSSLEPGRKGLLALLSAEMGTGPKRVVDDSRQSLPIVATQLRATLLLATGDHRARLLTARREIRSHGAAGRIVLAIIVALLFAGIGWGSLSRAVAIRPMTVAVAATQVALGVFIPWSILRGSAGIRDLDVRKRMLANALCPSCGSDLSTVRPDPDLGSRTCDECGGVWGRSAVLEPPAQCRKCNYDICGLKPDQGGHVMCPECGTISATGLKTVARERVRCVHCQASLGGSKLDSRNMAKCPACSMWSSGFTQHDLDMAAQSETDPTP